MLYKKEYIDELIPWILENKPTKHQIHMKKLELCQKHKQKDVPTDIEVYLHTPEEHLAAIRPILQTKPTRTSSGVAIIATMTAPSLCPHGACIFCPGGIGSVYGDTPMSYTGTEPSTMRAMRNEFDSYRIIFNRLQQYIILGQKPDKCEQIIQGGTFPSYSKEYQEEFVYFSFKAYNDFSKEFFNENGDLLLDKFKTFFELPNKVGDKARQERIKERIIKLRDAGIKSLEEEQVENETAVLRCIGLTIETKPDWGFQEHGLDFLRLGATRVELGVQTVYDDILQAVNRGHTIEDTYKSVAELRDLAFKLNFHMMPGLPTQNGERIDLQRDFDTMRIVFEDERLRPDMIKIYPCMVMPGTPLKKTFDAGIFKPVSTDEAANIIVEAFKYVPEYCRIMRVQRDIPTFSTTAGVNRTNLRQYVDKLAQERGIVSRDIRAREVKRGGYKGEPQLVVREYIANKGKEFFISFEADDKVLGFTRLRIAPRSLHPSITTTTGLIRELHVYGQAVPIGAHTDDRTQHQGFGRRLMEKAESIAKEQGCDKMLVISGVGVRGYYRMLGYARDGPYMGKNL